MVTAVRNLVAAGQRDRLVLATGANIPFGFSVRGAFEKALRTFGVDRVDVFLLFWVQAHWYVTGNTWKEMARLKESGLVRALGISCHDRPMARTLVDELGLDTIMIRYNAAHRGAEKEIFASLPAERTQRVGVVSYTATRWGHLLKPTGGEAPMTGPECYRFVLGHPAVDVVLCGAKSFDEVRENAAGIDEGPLTGARLDEIRHFGDRVRSTVAGRVVFGGA
jgi:aryl-alcohol dehydrogenase-like predicted oxidoreductase